MGADPADPSLESIFVQALATTDPAEREAYLERVCGTDADLRMRVERLIQAHDDAGRSPGSLGDIDRDATAAAPFDRPGPIPEDRPSSEAAGARVGPYKLLQEIGQGGMGAVYMAEQEKPVRRRVALKIIKQGMDTRQVVARFEAERQALALMDHSNIAKVLDAGTTESGRPYFVMDLVKGVPITQYCDDAKLDTRERLKLFIPVCRAIQHAHQKGIIHRDIKPSNVMVTLHDGVPVPRVIDFGVAKATDQRLTEKTMFTQYGAIVGTLEYMSPEQAEMSGLDVDTRSDIYSLGVLLYELLTGTTPLERGKLREAGYAEILRRIKEEEPPKPSTRLSHSGERLAALSAQRGTEPARLTKLIRGELDWIVMKSLEKDRTRRYETASGFARDIELYLAGDPVEAGPPSAAYRLRKLARKYRGALTTAVVVAVVLASAVVVSAWQAVRATRAERRAVDEAARALTAETEARAERDHAIEAEREAISGRNAAVESKKEAEKQAAIARAVNDFLQNDLLAEASPQKNARAEKVTVEELLKRAAARIGGKFEKAPEVEAAIRLTVAVALSSLGLFSEAQPHLEGSLEIRRRVLGPGHRDTIIAQYKLGELYIDQGRYLKAEEVLCQTLETARRALGPERPDTLETLNDLALLYNQLGRYAEAEGLFRQLVEIAPRVYGSEGTETLIVRGNLAISLAAQKKWEEAENLLLPTIEIANRVRGPDNTIGVRYNLARLYADQGRLAEGESLLRQVFKDHQRVYGLEHPTTLKVQHDLAMIYRKEGRLAEAESLFQKTLEARRPVLGPEHADILYTQRELGELYRDQGRFFEAEKLFRQTLAAWRKVSPADNSDLARALVGLGLTLIKLDRPAEAEPLLREAMEIEQKKAPDGWDTFETRSRLGAALLGQKKYAGAEPLLVQGYEGMKAREATIPPHYKKRLTEAAERIVQLYDAWGKPEQAAVWRKRLQTQ